jgi:Kazal-type serine protease inhibitor-like protein
VCCNASCGICAEPGAGCIAIACTDECTSNADCAANEYCTWPGGTCGDPSTPGICAPRPDACTDEVRPACGCDGRTYSNPCDAAAQGVPVSHEGACVRGPCDAQDARGEGLCPTFFGVRWNGQRCEPLGGCSCVGPDCGALYPDLPTCETARSGCASCVRQDAAAAGDCTLSLGYAWDGSSCIGLSGCSCAGGDCDSTYSDPAACAAAHAHCSDPCARNADCATTEYCHFDLGECRGSGVCMPRPGELPCPFDALPVCGCNGVTYGCESAANQVGVSVWHEDACAGACAAMDAFGQGACTTIVGVRWNGTACEAFSGCSCGGTDCGRVFATAPACEAAYAGCERAPGGVCGTIAGLVCRPDEWCDFDDPLTCGFADEGGVCRPRPSACLTVIDPVCGCDGSPYDNECWAQKAGVDVLSAGSCP